MHFLAAPTSSLGDDVESADGRFREWFPDKLLPTIYDCVGFIRSLPVGEGLPIDENGKVRLCEQDASLLLSIAGKFAKTAVCVLLSYKDSLRLRIHTYVRTYTR